MNLLTRNFSWKLKLSNKCANILFSILLSAVFPFEILRDNHISRKKRKRVSSSMNKLAARRRGDSREIIASIVRNANSLSLSFFSRHCRPISRCGFLVHRDFLFSRECAFSGLLTCWLCLSRENRDRFVAFSSLPLPSSSSSSLRDFDRASNGGVTSARSILSFSFSLFRHVPRMVLSHRSRYASDPGRAKVSRVLSRDADVITEYWYVRIDALTFRGVRLR